MGVSSSWFSYCKNCEDKTELLAFEKVKELGKLPEQLLS